MIKLLKQFLLKIKSIYSKTIKLIKVIVVGVILGLTIQYVLSIGGFEKWLSSQKVLNNTEPLYKLLNGVLFTLCKDSANGTCPVLYVVDTPIDNAFYYDNKIVITTGIISHMKSIDEAALVLAHELGHANQNMSILTPQIEKEHNADQLGAFYMMRAGFNICKGREVFKYWYNMDGDFLTGNHPTHSYRYISLNIKCTAEDLN